MNIAYLNKDYLIAALEVSQANVDVPLDGLIMAYTVSLVAGTDVAAHMPDAGVGGNPTSSLEDALRFIPANWFIFAMGEVVTPIHYKDDTHENRGFYAKLQHRKGGRMQEGRAASLEKAVCIVAIKALHIKYVEGVL